MSFRGMLGKAGIYPDGAGNIEIAGALSVRGGFGSAVGVGKVFYLDPANGSDTNNGRRPSKAFASIATAYAALTANRNDVLVYLGGSSSLTISSLLTWAKDYTHFIGICAPTHMAQRARIFNSGDLDLLLKIEANGCMFRNFYIFQGGTQTSNIGCVEVTGARNYFENVHFAGMGDATPAGEVGGYSLKLNGAEENLFVDCTIGLDTIIRTNTSTELLLDGAAARNEFRDCKFISFSENTGKVMVKINDSTAIDRFLIFKDCLFSNFSVNHVNDLLECISMPAGMQTCDIIIRGDCLLVNIEKWEENNRGNVWIGVAPPAAATSGIAVEPT